MADGDDKAGFLGDGDELVRAEQAEFRMLPAQRRLGARQPAAGQVDPRLVMQGEFIAVQGAMQAGLQDEALQLPRRHLAGIELVRVPAALLRLIEGGPRAVHQGIGVPAAERIARDADAGRDQHFMAVEFEGRAHRAADAFGHLHRIFRIGAVLQQHAELVMADPGEGRDAAQAVEQALGRAAQKLFAGGRAHRFVGQGETVEGAEHQDETRVALPRLADRAVKPVAE
jgi:hypothetical protein